MQAILLAIHLVIAVFLIALVMLQKSEGGALGIGGGQGGSLFSSRGVGSTLTRATAILAACFFATSIALTILNNKHGGSLVDSVIPAQTPAQTTPVSGAAAPAAPGTTDGGSVLLPKLDQGKPAVPTNQ